MLSERSHANKTGITWIITSEIVNTVYLRRFALHLSKGAYFNLHHKQALKLVLPIEQFHMVRSVTMAALSPAPSKSGSTCARFRECY
jgi:hypothetical protein